MVSVTYGLAEPAAEQSTLGGQNLKLSSRTAVLKKVSLLIGRVKHVDWGGRPPRAGPVARGELEV